MTILLGVTWSKYTNMPIADDDRDEIFYMGMPVGPKFAMGLLKKGTLSFHVAVDPMLSGILALLGEDWEMVEGGAQFDFRVIKNITSTVRPWPATPSTSTDRGTFRNTRCPPASTSSLEKAT